MDISKFHLYSLGIVAANKKMSETIIEVVPIEIGSFVNGELTDEVAKYNTSSKDSLGANYSSAIDTTVTIRAEWLPVGNSNRITAPDVRRAEQVLIYRFADTDQYWWTTYRHLDQIALRKLETVIYGWSGTTDEASKMDSTNSYFLEVSTHQKLMHLHTSNANGEPYQYDIQINTGTGFIQIQDDQGNYIKFDTVAHQISMVNQDGSVIEVNKTNINLACIDNINMQCNNFNLNTKSSINGISPNINTTGKITQKGDVNITGNTGIDGDITTSGSSGNATFAGNTSIIGNTSVEGSLAVVGGSALGGGTSMAGGMGVEGSLDIKGDLNISGSLHVKNSADIGGTVTITEDLNVKGNTTVAKDTVLDGSLNTTGNVTLNKDVSIGGNITINNNLLVNGDTTLNGQVSGLNVITKEEFKTTVDKIETEIHVVSNDLGNEVGRATSAEKDMQVTIDSNTNAIDAEVIRAKAEESVLTNQITAIQASVTALSTPPPTGP